MVLLADDAFVGRHRIEEEAPVLHRAEGGFVGLQALEGIAEGRQCGGVEGHGAVIVANAQRCVIDHVVPP
jgi:hypothetical protein